MSSSPRLSRLRTRSGSSKSVSVGAATTATTPTAPAGSNNGTPIGNNTSSGHPNVSSPIKELPKGLNRAKTQVQEPKVKVKEDVDVEDEDHGQDAVKVLLDSKAHHHHHVKNVRAKDEIGVDARPTQIGKLQRLQRMKEAASVTVSAAAGVEVGPKSSSSSSPAVGISIEKFPAKISGPSKPHLPVLSPCPTALFAASSSSGWSTMPKESSAAKDFSLQEDTESDGHSGSTEPKVIKKGDQVITTYVDEETGRIAVYEVGVRLEVNNFSDRVWYPAKIVQVDTADNEILVHYENWHSRFDEWIKMDSNRLRPSPNTNVVKTEFEVGEKVEALWSVDGQRYPGIIQTILPNDYYQVLFDDGIKLKKKYNQIFKLKKVGRGRSSNSNSSNTSGKSKFIPPPPTLVPAPSFRATDAPQELVKSPKRRSKNFLKPTNSSLLPLDRISSPELLSVQAETVMTSISPEPGAKVDRAADEEVEGSTEAGRQKQGKSPVVHHSIFDAPPTEGKRKRATHNYSMFLKIRHPRPKLPEGSEPARPRRNRGRARAAPAEAAELEAGQVSDSLGEPVVNLLSDEVENNSRKVAAKETSGELITQPWPEGDESGEVAPAKVSTDISQSEAVKDSTESRPSKRKRTVHNYMDLLNPKFEVPVGAVHTTRSRRQTKSKNDSMSEDLELALAKSAVTEFSSTAKMNDPEDAREGTRDLNFGQDVLERDEIKLKEGVENGSKRAGIPKPENERSTSRRKSESLGNESRLSSRRTQRMGSSRSIENDGKSLSMPHSGVETTKSIVVGKKSLGFKSIESSDLEHCVPSFAKSESTPRRRTSGRHRSSDDPFDKDLGSQFDQKFSSEGIARPKVNEASTSKSSRRFLRAGDQGSQGAHKFRRESFEGDDLSRPSRKYSNPECPDDRPDRHRRHERSRVRVRDKSSSDGDCEWESESGADDNVNLTLESLLSKRKSRLSTRPPSRNQEPSYRNTDKFPTNRGDKITPHKPSSTSLDRSSTWETTLTPTPTSSSSSMKRKYSSNTSHSGSFAGSHRSKKLKYEKYRFPPKLELAVQPISDPEEDLLDPDDYHPPTQTQTFSTPAPAPAPIIQIYNKSLSKPSEIRKYQTVLPVPSGSSSLHSTSKRRRSTRPPPSRRWRARKAAAALKNKSLEIGLQQREKRIRKPGDILNGLSAGRLAKVRQKLAENGFDHRLAGEAGFKDVCVDIISCSCGVTGEHGLMVQCELCQCWQHGNCFGIEDVEKMPPYYICEACRRPDLLKNSHRDDWIHEFNKTGVLPRLSFHSNVETSPRIVQDTNDLLDRLYQVRELINSTHVKINISDVPEHPKIYQWHSPHPTPQEEIQNRNFSKTYRPVLKRLLKTHSKDLSNYKAKLREKVERVIKARDEKLASERNGGQLELNSGEIKKETMATDENEDSLISAVMSNILDEVEAKLDAADESKQMNKLASVAESDTEQSFPVLNAKKEDIDLSTAVAKEKPILNLMDISADMDLSGPEGTAMEQDLDAALNLNPDRLLKSIEDLAQVSEDPEDNDLLLNIFDDPDFSDPICPPAPFQRPPKIKPPVNSGPALPVRITPELCRINLVQSIEDEQRLVDEHLDAMEAKVIELEKLQTKRTKIPLNEKNRLPTLNTTLKLLLNSIQVVRRTTTTISDHQPSDAINITE